MVSASFSRLAVITSTTPTAVVNRIATQGVRVTELTIPSGAGTTPSRDIP